MASPKLNWNQLLAGKRPRGSGSLGELRTLLWRMLRICEEGAFDSLAAGDIERLFKFMNTAALLSARYRDASVDAELSRKLDDLQTARNGMTPRAFTWNDAEN